MTETRGLNIKKILLYRCEILLALVYCIDLSWSQSWCLLVSLSVKVDNCSVNSELTIFSGPGTVRNPGKEAVTHDQQQIPAPPLRTPQSQLMSLLLSSWEKWKHQETTCQCSHHQTYHLPYNWTQPSCQLQWIKSEIAKARSLPHFCLPNLVRSSDRWKLNYIQNSSYKGVDDHFSHIPYTIQQQILMNQNMFFIQLSLTTSTNRYNPILATIIFNQTRDSLLTGSIPIPPLYNQLHTKARNFKN